MVFPACETISATVLPSLQYGLMNALEKEIWWNAITDDSVGNATKNLTLFEDARMSAKWLGWRKLTARTPQYEQVSFLRSPGCKENGQFTRQKTFEQIFLHTFNILKDSKSIAEGQLKKIQLEGYLNLRFGVDRPIQILTSPEKVKYIYLLSPSPTAPLVLPEGWISERYQSEQPLELNLLSLLEQLESSDGHIFMGPLPKGLNLLSYGSKL